MHKYREYAHGKRHGERRIVLDESLLSAVTPSIRVVEAEILLERFVKTVEEQAKIACQNSETLLVMIFGHGYKHKHTIAIGGNRKTKKSHLLEIELLKRVIPKGINVTLLLTSCFSGGWLIQPSFSKTSHINATGVAWSGPEKETRPWSIRKSFGRACGTSVATSILQKMIEFETEAEEHRTFEHPTYVGFSTAVYDRASQLDRLLHDQQIYFSAQDDEWEAHWAKRTVAPLEGYKARWEALRAIPAEPLDDQTEAGTERQRHTASLHREFEFQATEYMRAKPGRDSSASNVAIHSTIRHFFGEFTHSTPRDKLGLEHYLEKIKSRLAMMGEVDESLDAMDIKFTSCFTFCMEDHQADHEMERRLIKRLGLWLEVDFFSNASHLISTNQTKASRSLWQTTAGPWRR